MHQHDHNSPVSLDDAATARRKAGARRTAWIVAGIAAFFFIAALVHGHYVGISNWVNPGP